jgi:hypothetical protein
MNNERFVEAFANLNESENERPENLDKLISKMEELGWEVQEPFTYSDGTMGIEFGQYTPCGEDWYESMEIGDNIDYFISRLQDRVNYWDSDEEAEIWIDMRGQRGVPTSIRDLLDDADWKLEQLTNLLAELQKTDFEIV